MMIISAILFFLFSITLGAQTQGFNITEIDGKLLEGRLLDDAPAFQRVPISLASAMTAQERRQGARPIGQYLSFKTESTCIGVKTVREGVKMGKCNGPISMAGFDLYIKYNDKWLWAGAVLPEDNEPSWLVTDMKPGMKECLLYLPLGCQVKSLQICHTKDSKIEPESFFRNKIAVFGSSFTEGAATSRPGMTWCAQLSRQTGVLFANFGFAGNAKLQDYFSEILVQMDVDAYVIDGFSNPTPDQMRERLMPFIMKIRMQKPDTPIIFLKSIYREARNFNVKTDAYEQERAHVSDSLMRFVQKEYDDVYWITTTSATDHKRHETSVDGTHPSDYGYTIWADSIRKTIMKILKKHKLD